MILAENGKVLTCNIYFTVFFENIVWNSTAQQSIYLICLLYPELSYFCQVYLQYENANNRIVICIHVYKYIYAFQA